jgi:hypothetical protein
MKLVNYFGEEFEREKELTNSDLNSLKDRIEIYIAMGSKEDIKKTLKMLTPEEAKLICRSAQLSYITSRMRYGY